MYIQSGVIARCVIKGLHSIYFILFVYIFSLKTAYYTHVAKNISVHSICIVDTIFMAH